MRNIKMLIAYDGTRYQGWQKQKETDNTIQGKLEKVISQMLETTIEIIGSGRTDAGTHALGQVANFRTVSTMSLKEMHRYINHYLPQDIVVKQIEEVEARFHARYNVVGKKYVYYIWNHWIPSVFDRKYSYHVSEALDLVAMKEASKRFVGTHDFLAFSSLKKTKKTTVRTIQGIEINRTKEHMIELTFVGDGFLYNMVRIMVGTLIEIGLGRKDISYIDEIFKVGKREEAGETVPAQGLFLMEVYYE